MHEYLSSTDGTTKTLLIISIEFKGDENIFKLIILFNQGHIKFLWTGG